MLNKIMKIFDTTDEEMNIVVGCSRLGSDIAAMLSKSGNVICVDKNEDGFRKLPPEYSGYSVTGDGTDIDVLEKAGIKKAASVIAVTGDDNANLMIAQIAKVIFNVKLVVARLYDPEKEVIIKDIDIKIIEPNVLSLTAFEQMLSD